MDSEEIILTDRDSVSGQLLARPASSPRKGIEDYAIWVVLSSCLLGAVVAGGYRAANPIDGVAAVLVLLPAWLMILDIAVGIQVFRLDVGGRALSLPAACAAVHALIWVWAKHLTDFEVFYRLHMRDAFYGVYEVRLSVAILLLVLALLALSVALYQIGVLGQLFLSHSNPGMGAFGLNDVTPLHGHHIVDAQVLLHNLGFDVGGIDGSLGPKTTAALKQLQMEVGGKPSGVVTAATLETLRTRAQVKQSASLTGALARYWVSRFRGFLQGRWPVSRKH
ncbi:MAG: peptidoglycan-binding domain-containing protein [bacterium]|nr:peptidoglycan-binding domain-containing protein [bacterium]